jgi:hypothetical protein
MLFELVTEASNIQLVKRKAYKILELLQVECEYPGGERRLFRDNTQIFSTFYPAHSVVEPI